MTELERRIVAVLVALGEGEVVSYGDVAHDAGFPGRARAVGSLLAATDLDLPWWRVVRSDGRLATDPAHGVEHAALGRRDGRGHADAGPGRGWGHGSVDHVADASE